MSKVYNESLNVYDAANKRIDFIFKNFERIYVSFSGGKDSGVMLNLCIDYMRKRINKYIKEWESRCYKDGIPDEAPSEIKDKVPSYKQICIAILNNDYALKSLGLSTPTSPYYTELKKIELRERYKDDPVKLVAIDNYKKKK